MSNFLSSHFFGFSNAMATKLWDELQLSFGDNEKLSDLTGGEYSFMKSGRNWTLRRRKSHLVKNFADNLTEISGTSFYWRNRYAKENSGKSFE